jgi:hypothetical protein
MAVVGSKIFVFGGQTGRKVLSDMWTIDLCSRTIAHRRFEPF